MTTPVNFPNPANSGRTLNVTQTNAPNQVTFVQPGEPFAGHVHSSNTITIAEGNEVLSGDPSL